MKTLQQLTDKIIDEWMCLPASKRIVAAEQAWLEDKIREVYVAGAEAMKEAVAFREGDIILSNTEYIALSQALEKIWPKELYNKAETFLASLEKPDNNS